MNLIPQLPPPWVVTGALYTADNPMDLGEDMFEAELPGQILITAGWSSEGDPQGHYRVAVTKGLCNLLPPYQASSLTDAAAYIAQLAADITENGLVGSSLSDHEPTITVGDGITPHSPSSGVIA
jgi:hypothetical protein